MTPCRPAVNTVGLLKLRVPQGPWYFLTRYETISFTRHTILKYEDEQQKTMLKKIQGTTLSLFWSRMSLHESKNFAS